MRNKKALWIIQGLILVVVAWFVWRSVQEHWREFKSIDLDVSPVWIGAALLTVWAAYAVLIAAWRHVLVGWEQRIALRPAAGIWCVSNLGRYLPGKVWSIAGLAVLAERKGVSGWAAAGSAVVMQVLAIGTGAAVVFLFLPGATSPAQLAGAVLTSTALVFFLTWERGVGFMGRIAGRRDGARVLPLGRAVFGALATALSWFLYGLAFWLLARGILPEASLNLSIRLSTGVFAAGYITGLLALVVPGGVGVREAVFLTLLAPGIGGGAALALSVASRLLMTIAEVLAALIGLGTGLITRGDAVE